MTDSNRPQLRRSLGFWALAIYGIGDILGAGIYALVGKVAGIAGSASWLSFAIALSVAALTAVTYAELGGRFPKSAGESFFAEQAFRSKGLALVVGWVVLCSGVLSLATVSVAFGGYMTGLVPELPVPVTVVGILLLLAAINFRGMRESSATNIVATMIELTGLLIVIVAGALFLGREDASSIAQTIEAGRETDWTSIARGSALAFFAFIGFEDMVNVAEEVKDARRTLPRAILTALAVAGGIYMLISWLTVQVVPPAQLAASKAPLLEVVRKGAPAVPDGLFTAIAIFAVTNTALLNYVMGSRLLYGMSRQGLLPSWLGEVHEGRRTPHWAILTVLMVALTLALSGSLTYLAGSTSLLLLLVFFTLNVSLMTIKRRDDPPKRTFCAPPAAPVLGAVTCLGLMPFVPAASLLTAAVIVALGLGLVWRRKRSSS